MDRVGVRWVGLDLQSGNMCEKMGVVMMIQEAIMTYMEVEGLEEDTEVEGREGGVQEGGWGEGGGGVEGMEGGRGGRGEQEAG